MRYDYDMFSIIPDEVQSQFQGMFNELGLNEMASEQLGLWRDVAVVEALLGADPIVKDLFRASGFGINHYTSGAPDGRFFERDRVAREGIENKFLDALAKGLDDGSLVGANWNGFVLDDFLGYLEDAKPIDEIEVQEVRLDEHKAAMVGARKKKVAAVVMAVGFVALGFAAVSMMSAPVTIASL